KASGIVAALVSLSDRTGQTWTWPRRYSAAASKRWGRNVALGQPPTGLAHQFLVEIRRVRRRNADHRVVAIGRDHRTAVAEQADGLLTCLDGPDASPDLVAEKCDASVGRAEMFESMNGDRPLRHLRLEIPGMTLAVLVGLHASWLGSMTLRSAHHSGVM